MESEQNYKAIPNNEKDLIHFKISQKLNNINWTIPHRMASIVLHCIKETNETVK